MRRLIEEHDSILIEAAVVERLRRGGRAPLHPRLEHVLLIYDEPGRAELRAIYQGYMDIAREAGLPLLLCTPTWRANRERVQESGIEREVNEDAVRFMVSMRAAQGDERSKVRIGGVMGCRNDCYRSEEGLSAEESEKFHSWQVSRLAQAGVDFLIAETMPNVDEAIGVARAMAATGVPYIISFVINRTGRVLDGTALGEAVDMIDGTVASHPLGYMVNCAHPSFLCAAEQPKRLFARLMGYQANASSLDHADLDGSCEPHADEVSRWGDEMLALKRQYGVKILGGCCGTGVEHLQYLARNLASASR